ncbi:cyclase family protein [Acetomicrobium sp. S15 = DSM 107314]|uniref:cyclase family protein n=1 Tax=Acetomicrobium sp. S15 = DSM 107314 TaxID=2529858 RepID=UPI0018E1C89A|nr:cyclase family protein [Acetomicrobium sp. S15 = DSM 107314]
MHVKRCGLVVAFVMLVLFLLTPVVIAEEKTAPAMEPWWPSRYGPDDTLGTLNEITPQKIAEAAMLVKKGKVIELGTEYSAESPGFPPRFWQTQALAHKVIKPLGENKFVWLEEQFEGCPGVGTQIDVPSHVGVEYAPGDIRFYNGAKLEDVLDTNKALVKKYGIESMPPVITRGVLVDMESYKGRRLEAGEVITVSDIEGFLKQHKLELRPGDALLINTGWMYWYKEDPKKFISGEPGIGKEVVPWMYEKRIAFIGTDQWSTEVVPMEDPDEAWPVHCETIAKRGFTWGQDLVLDGLAKDCAEDGVYEFMFVFTFPKITGTTQGIGNPVAIK